MQWAQKALKCTIGFMVEHQVREAGREYRLPIYRMLELYQYELSDIYDQDLDQHGEYGYALDQYWSKEGCRPYVALVAGHYAGFALVNRRVVLGPDGNWMDQFFVLKKYRGQGLGRALALRTFADFPGPWEVGQMTQNHAARAFWRKVISDFVGSSYSEHLLSEGWWQGSIQRFVSSGVSAHSIMQA